MEKTFSIDLKSLYEHIYGNTIYGYWIEHEESDDGSDGYYDLKDSSALYACDGEVCEVVGVEKDYVLLTCVENRSHKFALTKEEFGFVCHE
jgi:hypothetical protein|nr:MAG TPA: hypothetical protein [Caudoviricetes sp.]